MTDFIVAVILLIASFVMLSGKGAFLLAGYNTMSREKKSKYNSAAVSRAGGVMLLLISVILLILNVIEKYADQYSDIAGKVSEISIFSIIIVGIIVLNTSKRFKNKNDPIKKD